MVCLLLAVALFFARNSQTRGLPERLPKDDLCFSETMVS